MNGANTGLFGYVQPIARWDHNFNDRDRLYALFHLPALHAGTEQQRFPFAGGFGDRELQSGSDQNYIIGVDTRGFRLPRLLTCGLPWDRFTEYFPESNCGGLSDGGAVGHFEFSARAHGGVNAAPRVDVGFGVVDHREFVHVEYGNSVGRIARSDSDSGQALAAFRR